MYSQQEGAFQDPKESKSTPSMVLLGKVEGRSERSQNYLSGWRDEMKGGARLALLTQGFCAMVGGVRGAAKYGTPPTKNSPALGQYQLLPEL